MEGQYCFKCGAATVAMGSRAVPICAECRAERTVADLDAAEWMVKRPGARARGPMTREAVLLGLARERIDLDDLVGRVGAREQPLCEHPDFRACFIPGSADERRVDALRQENQAGISRARQGRIAKQVLMGALVIGTAAVMYTGFTTRMFLLPADALDELVSGWGRVADAVVREDAVPRLPDALPHDDWLAKATAQVEPSDVPWAVDLQRARALLWAGDRDSIKESRRAFLRVLSASPLDPEAIGGLAEATAADRYRDPRWLEMASLAVARAQVVGDGSLAAQRARAALALAEGNTRLTLQLTETCSAEDVGCRLLRAEAQLDIVALRGIAEDYPQSVRVQLALGRVALEKKAWAQLGLTSRNIVERWPEEGAAWAMASEAYAAAGRWTEAREAAVRAISLDSWRNRERHLAAAVDLWGGGANVDPLASYRALLGREDLSKYSDAVAAQVQGGIAALRADELELARVWVDGALAADKEHVGAKVLSAAVHQAAGSPIAAKGVLRDVDHSLIHGPVGARMHYWAGVLFLDMGQQRLARTELESASTADPHWGAPQLEMAWAKLDSGDALGASDTIRGLGWKERGLRREVDLRSRVDLGPAPVRKWRKRISDAMSSDVRLSLKLDGTLAVLDWYTGQTEGGDVLLGAVESGDTDLNLQAALALSLLEAKDWAGSLAAADRVLASRRRAGLFHAVRGRALHGLGRGADSAVSFGLALKYSGDHPSILWWVMEARKADGDQAGVAQLLGAMKSLGIDPPTVTRLELARARLEE